VYTKTHLAIHITGYFAIMRQPRQAVSVTQPQTLRLRRLLGTATPHSRQLTVLPIYCYTVNMQNKVTINERGVITIPARMRDAFGLKANDELIIEDTENGLLLRPAYSVPIEVYSEQRISEFARDEDAIGKFLPPDPRK